MTGPAAQPASCKMGTGSIPGVKCGRGVLLTTHPLLVPRSWKSRAIPLPTLWATPGLYRDHFIFTFYLYMYIHTYTYTYRVLNPANVNVTYGFLSGTTQTRPKHNGRRTSEESVRTADEVGANCMCWHCDRSSRTGQSFVRG